MMLGVNLEGWVGVGCGGPGRVCGGRRDGGRPGVTLLAYRFALDPTPAQERALRAHAGAARVAFNWGLDQLARALRNWGDSRTGKRKGRRVGFPRFRSRRRTRLSVRFTTGAFRCERRHAALPRIGRVKLHEDGARLVDVVAAGVARVMSRHLTSALRKVRRPSRTVSRRRGPDRRTRAVPSNRWRRATTALGKAQGRVADQRRDALHKAASRAGRVIVADRWFPSSKTCSGCGTAKTKLCLSERTYTYTCAACGLVLDRDVNAARNLADYGTRYLAGSGPDSNGRGADRKTPPGAPVAVKRQPGTAHAGQTGTVPTQDGTAA